MDRLECHDWGTDGYPGEYVYGDGVYISDYYMDERWLPICDFPGYWVSDHGRVYGPGRGRRGNFLKPVLQNGYYKVTLTKNGHKIDKRINRLVAYAFKENHKNLPLVMHWDNDRTNNHIDNLDWGTHAENNQYCWDCGRHPFTLNETAHANAKEARRTPVMAINISTGERMKFPSQHDAARVLGVSQQHLWGVLKGIRRSTGGYRFEYLSKEECVNAY